MNKEFIPYEQALELKELGYDYYNYAWYIIDDGKPYITYFNYYGKSISPFHSIAPLYHQAFRFFREKYNLYSTIEVDQTMEPKFCYSLSRYRGDFQWDNILPTYSELYYTYEEAELACLKKLIEIVKNK